MPKNKSAATRYRIINDCINNKRKPFPTLENLANKCSDILGTDISTSTIEKDIAQMKKPEPIGYNAPIVYSKINKGYVYGEKGFSISELNLDDTEWEALNFASQLLYQYKEVPIFSNFKSAIERINSRFSLGFELDDETINQVVQFEKSIETKGYEWINIIYEAIQNKFAVAFTYHNIYKKETKAYQLVPYLLKEHRNRWYLIGWSGEKFQYVTFGLDRLTELTIIEQKQKLRSDFNAEGMFEFTTGIMEGNYKPTKVTLTLKHPLCELLILEPIHHSQNIISQNNVEIKIGLNVLVNEEFYLKLLSFGVNCTINKPASLRNKMKEIVTSMLINYQ